ncbi:transposable element Tcb2 transposase [Trichonephila clavipes]|nr:transposable element Tcb2 transposase [Trichonephila clavipes]
MHKQELVIEELESLGPVQSKYRMTISSLLLLSLIEKELQILEITNSNEECSFSTKQGIKKIISMLQGNFAGEKKSQSWSRLLGLQQAKRASVQYGAQAPFCKRDGIEGGQGVGGGVTHGGWGGCADAEGGIGEKRMSSCLGRHYAERENWAPHIDRGSVIGDRYCEEVLLPHVRLFRGAIGPDFIFMDDNARPHRTLAVEELLESEDITRMDWPAYSPDLNPIEHVWAALGRHIAARLHHPENTQQLKYMLINEWALLPQEMLHQLVLSMRRRCEATIASRCFRHPLLSHISEFHVSQMFFREVMAIDPPVA